MGDINAAVEGFIKDLNALRGMVDPVMYVTHKSAERVSAEHLAALEEHGTEDEPDGTTRKFHVPQEHLFKVRKLRTKDEQFRAATELLPRTFLVSFVSTYDAYLGNLIAALLAAKPEVLNASERLLTYQELMRFSDIEEARQHLVESEVESVLRQSHSDQFQWLEKVFSLSLRTDLDSWPKFIELTERRNLFVHCHGKVSKQYLAVCKKHGAEPGENFGGVLDAKRDYLVESYKVLFEIGVKLSQVMWRKLVPQELAQADSALINITFELLLQEKFELASRLLLFATKLRKHSSDVTKRVFTVNLAQAYKFSGRADACAQTLDSLDWSACSDNFSVCVSVLRDDFESAAAAMRRIGADGSVRQHEYSHWPVFREFRNTPQYSAAYAELFGGAPEEVLTHESAPIMGEDVVDQTPGKTSASDNRG